jgi:hypothetical protein
MQSMSRPRQATVLMRQRALRNRSWRYKKVAMLQQELDASVHESKWEQILRLLARGWLAPVDTDDLFELYVQVLVL